MEKTYLVVSLLSGCIFLCSVSFFGGCQDCMLPIGKSSRVLIGVGCRFPRQ